LDHGDTKTAEDDCHDEEFHVGHDRRCLGEVDEEERGKEGRVGEATLYDKCEEV
jgi:hypothetical protein